MLKYLKATSGKNVTSIIYFVVGMIDLLEINEKLSVDFFKAQLFSIKLLIMFNTTSYFLNKFFVCVKCLQMSQILK